MKKLNIKSAVIFLTAVSKHPSDNNKILIATVDDVLGKLYEVTLP
jgi:hypothetical protein